jgi:hypothetical protein
MPTHRAIGLLAGIMFGFFATLSAFIDGIAGLIAGPVTGILVGVIAAEISRTRELKPAWLRPVIAAGVSWLAGFPLLFITTWLMLLAWSGFP